MNNCGHTFCNTCWKQFRKPLCPKCSRSLITEPLINYGLLDIVNRLPQKQQKVLLPESSSWASTTKATSTISATDFEQQSVREQSSVNETPLSIIPNIRQQQVNNRQQQQPCKFFTSGRNCRSTECNFLHQGTFADVRTKQDSRTSLNSKEKPKQKKKLREKAGKEQPSELKRQENYQSVIPEYEADSSYDGNNEIETSYTEEDVYNYARDGDIDELRSALNQEEICQNWYTDPAGFNALHLAVRGGHSACVSALLDKVDIRLVDKRAKSNGYSPLHYASRFGFEKL